MAVFAKETDLQIWGQGGNRARYDYTSTEYLMSEMLTNEFFGLCTMLVRVGDYITITDAEDQIIVVRVDETDKQAQLCYISKVERLYALPVVTTKSDNPDDPGLTYRWRPTRAGGHSVITAKGEVFSINHDTKNEALRCIANCAETGVWVPPHGHEPTARFVSDNTKIYRAEA